MSIPLAASDLTATAVGSTQINLSWTDNSGDETGFKIYRSTDGGTFALLDTDGSTGSDVTSYNDTTCDPATIYYYYVVATNGDGDSDPSNTASAKTYIEYTVSGLTPGTIYYFQVLSVNASGDSVPSNTVAAVAGYTSYLDTVPTGGVTYYYRIKAVNASGSSVYSSTKSITPPVAPINLVASVLSDTEITLTWDDNGSPTGYEIDVSTSPDFTSDITTVTI